jgi:YD repeat-containing protein
LDDCARSGVVVVSKQDDLNTVYIVEAVIEVGIGRMTYTYDPADRRSLLTGADGTRTTWAYDTAGQLVRELRNGTQSLNLSHVYDPAGNRTLGGIVTECRSGAAVHDQPTEPGANRVRPHDLPVRRGRESVPESAPGGDHLLRVGR